MLLTVGACIVQLVLLHGYASHAILVNVMQTLMCFDDWSSVSVRQEVTALVNAGRHELYGHQPMKAPQLQLWKQSLGDAHATSHDSWCYPEPRVLELQCFMTINCITPLLAERTSVPRRSSSMHAVLRLAATSARCGIALRTQHSV
jgi:hypothetical protein